MEGFIKVAELKDFAKHRAKRVTIESNDVALFFVDNQFFAVQNNCPHQHFSMLHEGILNGCELTCPMHGWTFDLRTGKATIGSGKLKQYAVKVIGDGVWVEKPQSTIGWS